MTKPATFTNPGVQSMHDYWSVGSNEDGYACYTFARDKYDMQVTFERKPLKVGDAVRHEDYSFVWTILAIHGEYVWLMAATGNNPQPRTYHLDDVRPA